jgi:hypothetical protein
VLVAHVNIPRQAAEPQRQFLPDGEKQSQHHKEYAERD